MAIKLIQPGQGATRDVALLYLVGDKAKDIAAELGPDVCVVSENVTNWKDDTTPVAQVLAQVGASGFAVGRLWLIGFSAGCQGVRAQLNRGVKATHIIACDGIHLPTGTPQPFQLIWKDAAAGARLGYLQFSVSYSNTATTQFRTTKASAEYLFGASGCFGSYTNPCVEREGELRLYGATNGGGSPAEEHMDQLRKLLPRMIRDVREGRSLMKTGAIEGSSPWPIVVMGVAAAAIAWAIWG